MSRILESVEKHYNGLELDFDTLYQVLHYKTI